MMGMKPRKEHAGIAAYVARKPKPKKLRSRTWTTEGWNEKEKLAVTAFDFVRSLRLSDSRRTLDWGAVFAKDPKELDASRPAVRQRITVTIEDIP